MARQDIFATLSDDIQGDQCTSSSRRGKVSEIKTWINTDVVGDGICRWIFDEEKKNVIMNCNIPKKWKVNIVKKGLGEK